MRLRFFGLLTAIALIMAVGPRATAEAQDGHIYFAYTFTSSNGNGNNILDPFTLRYDDLMGKGVINTADAAKNFLLNMPEGKRCINIYLVSRHIGENPEATVFWQKGGEYVKGIITSFFKRLKEIDAPLDYIIDDMEHSPSNWGLNTEEKINAVTSHPLYQADIKPLLIEADFPFGTKEQGDLYYVQNWNAHPTGYLIWNGVLRNYVNKLYDQSIFEPIKSFYPNIKLSNYDCAATDGVTTLLSDSFGHKKYKSGAINHVGTHSSPVCYGTMNQITSKDRAPDGYPYKQLAETAFNCMLLELVKCQDAVLCTPNGAIMPWVGLKGWNEYKTAKNFMNTDYYQEFMFHAALLNADPFLVFDVGSAQVARDIETLSSLFKHMDEVTENQAGKPLITKPSPWSTRYFLTGMDLENKSIWRITPDLYTKGVSIDNFKASENPLAFQIGNQKIVFPEGSAIYKPSQTLSEYGYWITAPKGATPFESFDQTMTDPGEPVFTDDYIPTGYLYESVSVRKEAESQVQSQQKNGNAAPSDESFSDDENEHWASKELSTLVELGILKGTDNGIEPDKELSKAEFIMMLVRSTKIQTISYNSSLLDVSAEDWYADVFETAMSRGWITPLDNKINPNARLSRQETALILANALGVNKEPSGVLFTDHEEIKKEALNAVYGLAGINILKGYPDGNFAPNDILTRAQAAVIIYKAMI